MTATNAFFLRLFCVAFGAACIVAIPEFAFAKFEYRISPLLRANYLNYMGDIAGTENSRFSLRAELNSVFRWNRNIKLVLQPIAEFDPTAKEAPTGVTNAENNSERWYLDLREGYLQFRPRPFTIHLGNQVFTWGVTDGFSPVDVINPRRYVSPLQADKIGTPAATIKWNGGDFSMELVYIPVQRESILPGEDSRWLPRNFYNTQRSIPGVILQLPSNVRYFYLAEEELDDALKNNFAARIRGQLSSFDFSLMFFQGFSASPAINLRLAGGVASLGTNGGPVVIAVDQNVSLVPVYYKRRVIGGTIVYTLGEFIFRLESAATTEISDNNQKALPGDYHEHVLSVEHDFPVGDNVITAILQGTYSKYETDAENGTASLGRIFEGAIIAGLRYAPTETTSFIGSFIYDTKRKDNVLGLNAEHKFFDNLTTSLAVTFIDGDDLSPLGTYEKNDLLSLTVRYDF